MKIRIKEVNIKGYIRYVPQVRFGLFESTKYRKMKWLNLVDIDSHTFNFTTEHAKLFNTINKAEEFVTNYMLNSQKK